MFIWLQRRCPLGGGDDSLHCTATDSAGVAESLVLISRLRSFLAALIGIIFDWSSKGISIRDFLDILTPLLPTYVRYVHTYVSSVCAE